MVTALDRYHRMARLSGIALALVSTSALAQTQSGGGETAAAGSKRAWFVVPSLTVIETLTDNVALSAANPQRDQITEIAPGIRVEANTARLKVFADYQLRQVVYAQDSQRNQTQNALNAFGSFEALEKWMFVDFSGTIAQQTISAFGTPSSANTSVNANSTEISNFQVSPYIRGRLGGAVDYDVRYSQSASRSKSSTASNTQTSALTGSLKGSTPFTSLAWSINAGQQQIEYGGSGRSESEQIRALLSYKFSPEFRASINAGREANDFSTASKQSYATRGYGLDWTPGPRTQASFTHEKRFFGNAETFSLTHRMPRSVWTYSQSRDVSVLPNQFNAVNLGTINVSELLFAQFAAVPALQDPVLRAQAVSAYLQANQIPPSITVVGGFLSSQVFVQRSRNLSFTLLGARNTLGFAATQSESESLSSAPVGDFAQSPTIRQRGFSINFSHQLSGLTSLNLSGSRQNSTGTAASGLDSTLESLSASVSTRLGANTSATLLARRSTFDSATAPYRENATIGTLSVKF